MRQHFVCLLAAVMCSVSVTSSRGADTKVTPGNLDESRVFTADSSEQNSGSLSLRLEIKGDAIQKAQYTRVLAKSATDDTGKSLLKLRREGRRDVTKFQKSMYSPTMDLQMAPRQATHIQEVSGVVQMFFPQRDEQSVVTVVNFRQSAGRPIQAAPLKSAGLEVTVLTQAQIAADTAAEEKKIRTQAATLTGRDKFMADFALAILKEQSQIGDKGVSVRFNDPRFRLVDIVFEDAAGKPLKLNWSSSGDTTRSFAFKQDVPATTKLKIYLATPRSLIEAPFQFKELPLP